MIVTKEGENILADYDNWGVEFLRRKKLVWSGWDNEARLNTEDYLEIPKSKGYGARRIVGVDTDRLRLFFLSLLWRATVSNMPEFNEVSVRASQTRKLRRMLNQSDPKPYDFFPFSLTQLSSKGEVHNLTPLQQRKPADIFAKNGRTIKIFRFYMDGLIAHFHVDSDAKEVGDLGNMLIGGSDTMFVTVVPYESSWQKGNLDELVREAEERWPDDLGRIPGFDRTGSGNPL